MDECLRVLDERQEYLGDEILVQQVRLQLIVEKVNSITRHGGAMETTERMTMPPCFYLQALYSQLQEVKSKLPPRLRHSDTPSSSTTASSHSDSLADVLLPHLYSTELKINEIALSKVPIIAHDTNFQQLEYLHACVKSIKSWFDAMFALPFTSFVGSPFSICSQLVYCIITLQRLATLDDPAWDKEAVRKTADPLLILDQIINNIEQVATLAELNNDSTKGDIYSRLSKMFASMRSAWEAELGASLMVSTMQNVNETMIDALPLDFSDNDWLMDVLFSPNH